MSERERESSAFVCVCVCVCVFSQVSGAAAMLYHAHITALNMVGYGVCMCEVTAYIVSGYTFTT